MTDKPMVYIASPYTHGDQRENVRRQMACANTLAEAGFLPFWPLSSHFWHLAYPHPWQFWMDLDFEWVRRADMVLRLPGPSAGADQEVELAEQYNIPVYYSVSQLLAANRKVPQ